MSATNIQNRMLGKVFLRGAKNPFAINGLTGMHQSNRLSSVAFLLMKGKGSIISNITINTPQFLRA